jgi:hypothetical protein
MMTFLIPVISPTGSGRRELMVKDFLLTTYFCSMKMVEVISTIIAAMAAAKLAWSPTSLMNSE